MDQTTLKIGCGAMLHDIGKLAQDCMELTQEYRERNAGQYQPFYNSRHTHIHALYTAAFIEQSGDILPPEFNYAEWGEGDCLVNLAAGHHKPETVLQHIVCAADHLSAGLDRASFEEGQGIAVKDFRMTRLLPVLESLDQDASGGFSKREDYRWSYLLAPLSPESIFPRAREGNASRDDTRKEYQDLFSTFTGGLANLEDLGGELELWYAQFDSLLRHCLSMMPSARAGAVVHDISLYDHMRTTAAFAVALYLYHKDTSTLDINSVRAEDREKFLLVTGDFYGIQEFIFSAGGAKQKFRSKILRGRSFAVSLFAELAADMLCRSIGLLPTSIVLNAAGKFTVIAPNTEQAVRAVAEVEQHINDWLFGISCGQSTMGLAMTACRPAEFTRGQFSALYDRHMDNVITRKLQRLDLERYGGRVDGYLEEFNKEGSALCAFCGKRCSDPDIRKDGYLANAGEPCCRVCRDHIVLGTLLVKKTRVNISLDSSPGGAAGILKLPVFERYQLGFADGSEGGKLSGQLVGKYSLLRASEAPSPVQAWHLNGYIPRYCQADLNNELLFGTAHSDKKTEALIDMVELGDPKSFTHLAIEAKRKGAAGSFMGTEAIGVLKADIDNLGLLLGCGLPDARFSISRLATLSRQLDGFFSIYLPHLFEQSEEYKNIYTVFAGGDDLFLIGPWNRIVPLARHIRQRFAEYVCGNPRLTISAGVSFHKNNVPVSRMAAAAETALEQAKARPDKDSVTIFGNTVTWTELTALLENAGQMQRWLDEGLLSSAMFYRLNHLVALAGRAKKALALGDVPIEELDALKWRSMFSYAVQRNLAPGLKGDARDQALKDVTRMAGWLEKYGDSLQIPLWHVLYEKRI